MTFRTFLVFISSAFLFGCNAYRQKPESEISFTRQDLTRKGFVLAPISVQDEKLNPGPSELLSYDLILGNTLSQKWKSVAMLSSSDISTTVGVEDTEKWRSSLAIEDQKEVSPSTFTILKKLTTLGRTYPKQVLIPTLLQNTVSCGQKDAVSSYLSNDPHGQRNYCQRIIKMRFRIMSTERSELLWNGLIYATQEASEEAEVGGEEALTGESKEKKTIEAPSTQSLIRECFNNFAKQFSEK